MSNVKEARDAKLFWYAQEDSSSCDLFAAADTPIAGTRDQFDLARKRNQRLIERAIRTHALELQEHHKEIADRLASTALDPGYAPISGLEEKPGLKYLSENEYKLEQFLVETAEQGIMESPCQPSAPRIKRPKRTDTCVAIEPMYNDHMDQLFGRQDAQWADIRKHVAADTLAIAEKLRRNGIELEGSQFHLLEDLPRWLSRSAPPVRSHPHTSSQPSKPPRSNKRQHIQPRESSALQGPPDGQVASSSIRSKSANPAETAVQTPSPIQGPPAAVAIQIPSSNPISVAPPAAPPAVATATPPTDVPASSSSSSSNNMQRRKNQFLTDLGTITIRKVASKGVQVVCETKAGPICLGKPSQYDDANFDSDSEIKIGKCKGERIYRRLEHGRWSNVGPVAKIEPLIRRYFLKDQARHADLL